MCEENLRLPIESVLSCNVKGVNDLLHIVAVEFIYRPAERLVFGLKVAEAAYVIGAAVYLFLIIVNDCHKVVYMFCCCIHRCLPDLAFFLLAVAHQAEHKVLVSAQPLGLCRSCRHRKPLSE